MIVPINGVTAEEIFWYQADSGVDIHVPVGTQVVAAADGYLQYSEPGHVQQTGPDDTINSVLLVFSKPQVINGITYNYAWYTHLSSIVYSIPDSSSSKPAIKAGTVLGKTGTANGVAHLHFGILINRAQADGDFMPPEKLHDYLCSLLKSPTPIPTPIKEVIEIWVHDGKAKAKIPGKGMVDVALYIKMDY